MSLLIRRIRAWVAVLISVPMTALFYFLMGSFTYFSDESHLTDPINTAMLILPLLLTEGVIAKYILHWKKQHYGSFIGLCAIMAIPVAALITESHPWQARVSGCLVADINCIGTFVSTMSSYVFGGTLFWLIKWYRV